MGAGKADKLKLKRKEKKQKRKQRLKERRNGSGLVKVDIEKFLEETDANATIQIEYVTSSSLGVDETNLEEFKRVFEYFQAPAEAEDTGENALQDSVAGEGRAEGEDDDDEKDKLSNKQKKKRTRISVALLKQLVKKPERVEVHDANSPDPTFLLHLKCSKNVVPVPTHWTQKRRYLQGKRGVEKAPYELPDFIAATGISKIRAAMIERENAKKLKQKAREHMNPKLGQMDLDYQVLHDAFFRYQNKPKLTGFGDTYHEGKEFEVETKSKKPGYLSAELRKALGMPDGAPPPWLFNMQRFGPPPAYPFLKIPGVNAPPPEGASFGFHPGGWGKPQVDEMGRTVFAEVYASNQHEVMQPIERKRWGEIEIEEFEESEQDDDEDAQMDEDDAQDMQADDDDAPAVDGSGIQSVPTGIETPDTIQLSKQAEVDYAGKNLYRVLEQKDASVGRAFMGSTHTYNVAQEPAQLDSLAKKTDEAKPERRSADAKINYKF
jgi:splicing factor 3B subunit 2